MILLLAACAEDYATALNGDAERATAAEDVASGTLRVDVLPASGGADLLPQTFVLQPAEDGYPAQNYRLSATATLTGALTGEVLHGWGAAPTTVEAVAGSLDAFVSERSLQGAATDVEIGEDGRAAFDLRLPEGTAYNVRIVPDDATATPFTLETVEVSGSADWSQEILPGAPVYGRVTAADGTRIADAPLRIRRVDADVASAAFTADAGGWFVARVLPGYDYVLETISGTTRHGVVIASVSAEFTVENEEGATVSLDVGEIAPAPLSGRVIDEATGVPVEKPVVHVVSRTLDGGSGSVDLTVQHADNGEFTMFLLPGLYDVSISPPYDWRTSTPRVWTDLRVEPGGRALGDVLLAPPRALHGVVRNEAGEPIEGARVNAIQVDGFENVFTGVTGADGSYTIDAVPDSVFELEVSPPSAEVGAVAHRTIGPGESGDVSLRSGTDVFGSVSDPDGEVLVYSLVEIRDYASGRLLARATTDQDGAFAVRVDPDAVADTGN